eukprot:728604-Rhodomonas_salina.2
MGQLPPTGALVAVVMSGARGSVAVVVAGHALILAHVACHAVVQALVPGVARACETAGRVGARGIGGAAGWVNVRCVLAAQHAPRPAFVQSAAHGHTRHVTTSAQQL